MAFSFGMRFYPDWQRRYGICAICRQGIPAGEKVMVGVGFFHKQLVRNRNHFGCWINESKVRAEGWFFGHKFEPRRMSPEKKAELNRLRAKRWYIEKKGGEPGEVAVKLAELEKQIALVKSG